MQTEHYKTLLAEIEQFLAASGMSASYFGKVATGNSEVVSRLREGRRVMAHTEINIRKYIAERSLDVRPSAEAEQ